MAWCMTCPASVTVWLSLLLFLLLLLPLLLQCVHPGGVVWAVRRSAEALVLMPAMGLRGDRSTLLASFATSCHPLIALTGGMRTMCGEHQ